MPSPRPCRPDEVEALSFAETKEQLGGYYLIEADDLAEAQDGASQIPAAKYGTVEVRPILDVGQFAWRIETGGDRPGSV